MNLWEIKEAVKQKEYEFLKKMNRWVAIDIYLH